MKNELSFNEGEALNRPAYTSVVETGLFEAYKHKHKVIKGKFCLLKNYFVHSKGEN